MAIGRLIRKFRQAANKSQKALQDETGIPQTTLSGWENNKTEPQATQLRKLALALGVSVGELIGENAEARKSQAG
ncbi:MAG: Helix-turn-helix domain [Firmicutes bacterium]|nr:Helix-turn-helix domain [Bacillota bacterium]